MKRYLGIPLPFDIVFNLIWPMIGLDLRNNGLRFHDYDRTSRDTRLLEIMRMITCLRLADRQRAGFVKRNLRFIIPIVWRAAGWCGMLGPVVGVDENDRNTTVEGSSYFPQSLHPHNLHVWPPTMETFGQGIPEIAIVPPIALYLPENKDRSVTKEPTQPLWIAACVSHELFCLKKCPHASISKVLGVDDNRAHQIVPVWRRRLSETDVKDPREANLAFGLLMRLVRRLTEASLQWIKTDPESAWAYTEQLLNVQRQAYCATCDTALDPSIDPPIPDVIRRKMLGDQAKTRHVCGRCLCNENTTALIPASNVVSYPARTPFIRMRGYRWEQNGPCNLPEMSQYTFAEVVHALRVEQKEKAMKDAERRLTAGRLKEEIRFERTVQEKVQALVAQLNRGREKRRKFFTSRNLPLPSIDGLDPDAMTPDQLIDAYYRQIKEADGFKTRPAKRWKRTVTRKVPSVEERVDPDLWNA